MKRSMDPRVRKLARFLKPHNTGCPCYSCGWRGAEDSATKCIRIVEAAGLTVVDPEVNQ